ncbi:hypothetical protein I0C86_28050 [Plantactinospora sp. S1510]|uniref:Signal transduction histidine kinase n=1 Tax=Plantactinospora alkalitolerans TaxID=2789879 RepID=A0ABS0H381_9ACTN|nr:hypothetical protein [Plantactinospora alkalitolerans]MBF9132779.1 hypothetical protein [Plantactinospora alkalitolerans]
MSTELAGHPAGAFATTVERGPRIAAVVIAFGWHVVINLPAMLAQWPDYRRPWVVGAGWLIFTVVGLIAAANLLYGTPAPAWPLIGVLLLVDVAVFASTPASALFDSANFGWATLGWFVVLLLWGRRIPALVAVLAVGAAIALVAVLFVRGGDPADLSRYAMYVYGTATLPVAMMIAVNLLGALAGSTARAAAARTAIETERAAAGRVHRARRDRLAALDRTAGAILVELAEGRADPADPVVQRRCALEASRLRRLIAESDDVPDPLLHELRACVDVVERNGVPVDFVAVGTLPALPVEIRRQLAEPLTTTLAAATRWARLTVVGQPEEVVVSLTTAGTSAMAPEPASGVGDTIGRPGGDPSGGRIEYVYEENEELVWVQTRWRA